MSENVRQRFPKPKNYRASPTWPEGHRWHGLKGRCKAWNPKHGRQCLSRSVPDLDVCRKDGGASPRGLASPAFKDGRYSRYMPPRLAVAFERALADPELLSLTTDIATVETLINDTMEQLSAGDLAQTIGKVKDKWDQLWAAIRREDAKSAESIRVEMSALIDQGASQLQALSKFLDLTEQKRKLSETEARRREKMSELVEAERVARDYRALVLAVKAVEDDPAKLLRIQAEFGRIIGIDHLQRAEPG